MNHLIQKSALARLDTVHKYQLAPWMGFHQGLSLRDAQGAELKFSNVAYEGGPRNLFLGDYMAPFLDGLTTSSYSEALSLADEYGLDRRAIIQDTGQVVLSLARKTYRRMAEIDRRLLIAEGAPSAPLHDWEGVYRKFQKEQRTLEQTLMQRYRKPSALAWNRLVPMARPACFFTALAGAIGVAALFLGP